MFIGHYSLGLGARRISKLPSLAILFIAVEFLDLLWPIFCMLGMESFQIDPGNTALTPLQFTSYPYSHSLLMAVAWGFLFGGVYFSATKNREAAWLLFALVVSHWILDFITHAPDLQLVPFSEYRVGLGLWNFPMTESIIEVSMFVTGAFFYYRSANQIRKVSFWLLIIFFLVIHLLNVFGPPPPSVTAVIWSAYLMWIFVIWAWWIEKK